VQGEEGKRHSFGEACGGHVPCVLDARRMCAYLVYICRVTRVGAERVG
jgi:hypothetical protein